MLLGDPRLVPVTHAFEQLRDRHVVSTRQRPATALEPGQIEQVADDVFEPLGLVADDAAR